MTRDDAQIYEMARLRRRIDDLLASNNALLERARTAEARNTELESILLSATKLIGGLGAMLDPKAPA
jgi:hypothetical protein